MASLRKADFLQAAKHGAVANLAYAPFDVAERDRRLHRIWMLMRENGLAALVLTSEPNFRYVASFRSPTWVSVTRSRFAVVPLDGLPILIVPESNRILAEASGWATEVRTWPAPRAQDDGISLLLATLREMAPTGSIALEVGPDSRIGFPAADFLRLLDAIGRGRLADASSLMHNVRAVKSEAEQARHRWAASASSSALAGLSSLASIASTDRELHRRIQIELLDAGIEQVPYLVCAVGDGGYAATNTEPEGRAFRTGDVLFVDVGATVDGYFSDFNRHVAFGRVDEETSAVYRLVSEALDAGIAKAAPKTPLVEVWRTMAAVLETRGQSSGIGRLGHSIGLSLTEPPSIAFDSDAVLEPGMILAIEPSLAYAPAIEGSPSRLMVHEENILITETGSVLLSERGERELTVI